ncbi:hypothetical protein MMC29_005763 [Sticta canariensis]|nr:hypothetical protein [Sticta canariensis]
MVGSTLECSYYTPAPGEDQWMLVNGTPASCTQLGLHHLFKDLPPIDLVVSGPNFGRNATTIYNLSSGTVGGALEAALCRKKAIAISFASKDQQSSEVIAATARISVRLIEKLCHKWGQDVELYNINVPMTANVEACKILYTQALPSSWISGSLYQETKTNGLINGLSNGHINGSSNEQQGSLKAPLASAHKYFKWAPQLSDISRCVEESPPGTDAWALSNGSISVTPLKANFSHVQGFSGSLDL